MVLASVREKMKINNFLLVVTTDEIKKLKVKNVNFLFPITNYSVGFLNTYEIGNITTPNAYLYLNRIFDTASLALLEQDLKKLPKNIKGICFTDFGVLQIIRKINIDVQLFYMQNHNTTNIESIHYYLDEVDSLLLSTDITKEEMIPILDQAKKPLIVPYFMKVDVMYSRRKLLTNFQEEFSLEHQKAISLQEPISHEFFEAVENEYGTVFYHEKFIDYRNIKHNNILFYFINPLGLKINEIVNILEGKEVDASTHEGFLNQETYYQIKEEQGYVKH